MPLCTGHRQCALPGLRLNVCAHSDFAKNIVSQTRSRCGSEVTDRAVFSRLRQHAVDVIRHTALGGARLFHFERMGRGILARRLVGRGAHCIDVQLYDRWLAKAKHRRREHNRQMDQYPLRASVYFQRRLDDTGFHFLAVLPRGRPTLSFLQEKALIP